MIPSESFKAEIDNMYSPTRAIRLREELKRSQEEVSTGTMIGELAQTPIEPGWHLLIEEFGRPPRFQTLGTIGEYLVGRHPRCLVSLHSRFVSRLHALLTVHSDERLTLKDIGSMNGTCLNDTPLDKDDAPELKAHDLITLCESLITVIRVQ